MTMPEQYISIVVPGRMYAEEYRKMGLHPAVLSSALEGAGTVTSALVPWNTCGATQSSVLGVSTFTYLPYAFFCYLSPVMSILFAWLNIKIRRLPKATDTNDTSLTTQSKDSANDTMV
jgi:NhaC family Na+:H+ antiporter